jgi:hypothetical protein
MGQIKFGVERHSKTSPLSKVVAYLRVLTLHSFKYRVRGKKEPFQDRRKFRPDYNTCTSVTEIPFAVFSVVT